MPLLQIRKLPENIYNALKRAAKREHRSLSQQAIITLARGLNEPVNNTDRRKLILNKIKEENHLWRQWKDIDIAAWIREDRDRR